MQFLIHSTDVVRLHVMGLLLLLGTLTPTLALQADDILTVRVPDIEEHPDGYNYYYDVLHAALSQLDREYHLELVGPMTQIRARNMLQSGSIDVHWGIESADRNERYLSAGVGITDGLIGQRVLLILPEDQALFDPVETLEDFRDLELTAGFGAGWIDAEVWAANDLDYYEEPGNWRVIFQKLARNRGDFDYLSRSIKEVLPELASHPQLSLERRLLLVYDLDETFYVTPHSVMPWKTR